MLYYKFISDVLRGCLRKISDVLSSVSMYVLEGDFFLDDYGFMQLESLSHHYIITNVVAF